MKSYYIVKGFEGDLIAKLRLICTQALQALLANPRYREYASKARFLSELERIAQSYVMGACHSKLYNALCIVHRADDVALHAAMQAAQSMTLEQLGKHAQACKRVCMCVCACGDAELCRKLIGSSAGPQRRAAVVRFARCSDHSAAQASRALCAFRVSRLFACADAGSVSTRQ